MRISVANVDMTNIFPSSDSIPDPAADSVSTMMFEMKGVKSTESNPDGINYVNSPFTSPSYYI